MTGVALTSVDGFELVDVATGFVVDEDCTECCNPCATLRRYDRCGEPACDPAGDDHVWLCEPPPCGTAVAPGYICLDGAGFRGTDVVIAKDDLPNGDAVIDRARATCIPTCDPCPPPCPPPCQPIIVRRNVGCSGAVRCITCCRSGLPPIVISRTISYSRHDIKFSRDPARPDDDYLSQASGTWTVTSTRPLADGLGQSFTAPPWISISPPLRADLGGYFINSTKTRNGVADLSYAGFTYAQLRNVWPGTLPVADGLTPGVHNVGGWQVLPGMPDPCGGPYDGSAIINGLYAAWDIAYTEAGPGCHIVNSTSLRATGRFWRLPGFVDPEGTTELTLTIVDTYSDSCTEVMPGSGGSGTVLALPLARVPRLLWPPWIQAMAVLGQKGEKGVGSTVRRVIGDERSERFKRWYKEQTGNDCGCDGRQAAWDIMYSYRAK